MDQTPESETSPLGMVRGLQIAHFALMGGVMLFTVLTYVLVTPDETSAVATTEPDLTLTWVAALVIATAIPLAFVIRARLFARCSEIERADRAFQQFAAGSLVFTACLESAAIVALVVTFVQGTFTPTGWLVALPLAAMALGIPSEDQFAGLRRLR